MRSNTPCIKCGDVSQILVSRRLANGWRKRRRTCAGCKIRWNTYEVPQSHIRKMLSSISWARQMNIAMGRLKAHMADSEKVIREFGTPRLRYEFAKFKSRIYDVEMELKSIYGEQTVVDEENIFPEDQEFLGEGVTMVTEAGMVRPGRPLSQVTE